MSDIVKRLLTNRPNYDDNIAAAEEIERLTAERDALRAELAALRENSLAVLTRVRGYRDKVITERDALRALLREARQTLSYPASMLTRDNMCARIDALLSKGGGNDTSK